MAFTLKHLQSLIKVSVENGASDIHIRSDETPCLRIKGDLFPVQTNPFSVQDVLDITRILINDNSRYADLENHNELDGGFEIPDLCRLRYNFFRYNHKVGIVLRIVNIKIPTIKQLQLPEIIKEITNQKRGLVLVTGATGSGKSTTLAAMLNEINTEKSTHIVTVEDPIEYLHPQKKSRITQREIGSDTRNFSDALRSALRQDPDIILIGEMRDAETVSIALKAAETGHLVFSTVHTTDALSTINRIVSMFSPLEQDDIRKRLSESLFATISQRLIKSKTKSGRCVAMEVMVSSEGVKECVRGDEPLSRIVQIIQEGSRHGGSGTMSFDQHLMSLFERGLITKETALEAATSQTDFIQKLTVE